MIYSLWLKFIKFLSICHYGWLSTRQVVSLTEASAEGDHIPRSPPPHTHTICTNPRARSPNPIPPHPAACKSPRVHNSAISELSGTKKTCILHINILQQWNPSLTEWKYFCSTNILTQLNGDSYITAHPSSSFICLDLIKAS